MVWFRSRSRADAQDAGNGRSHASRTGLTLLPSALDGARSALALCFPRVCALCQRALHARERHLACGLCVSRLALLSPPQCPRCGHPGLDGCHWCAVLDERVRVARSVCWMSGGTGADFVHALKYSGWWRLAELMAERMVRLDGWRAAHRPALVAVPLARTRERERGYNQSAVLTSALAACCHISVWNGALERTRHTPTQTALTPQQRLANVADAFSVMAAFRARVRGAHLILVDDVITTGATMNACAAALFAAGARSVAYLTFGRARAPGDPPT